MAKHPSKSLLEGLSRFQKILLITDGTVTNLLEHHLSEAMKVVKLYEGQSKYHASPQLDTKNLEGLSVLEREILLQGEKSKSNWLYAKSAIFLENLPQDFLNDLLESAQPIGKLWSKYRLETYKRILAADKEVAGNIAKYFNIEAEDQMISRTYSVYSNKKVIMIITEKFPFDYFQD